MAVFPRYPGRFVLLLALCVGLVVSAGAQQRSPALDEPSVVYRPANFREGGSYPLVVFLPYTGGTASDQARAFGVAPGRQRDYFVMLPPGRFVRSDYLPNFTQFVSWVEERVILDIRAVVREFPVDPDQVYLAGYSLGGDLSWALGVRNADEISGMVMAGTRASYPISAGDLDLFSRRRHRIAMLIGNRENPDRYQGINRARATVEGAGLEVFYREYNGGHSIPPRTLLQQALSHVLAGQVARVAEQPRPAVPREQGRRGSEPMTPTGAPATTGDGSPPLVAGGSERLPGEIDIDWSFLHVAPTGFAELRYMPPAVFSRTTESLSGLHRAALSYEVLFGNLWLSGSTEYYSARTTTGMRVAHVPQRLTVGAFGTPGWGVGADWSWYSFFEASSATTAARRFALHGVLVHGGGPLALSGELTARIRAPLSLTRFALLDIANMELQYELEIADLVMIDAGVASYAEQNAPGDTLAELADNLDHLLRWNAGVAVRYPTRLRWGIAYTGETRRALSDSADASSRHLVQIQLGYLF
jgi:poly(3-hydroxybutyrate) depolymerase